MEWDIAKSRFRRAEDGYNSQAPARATKCEGGREVLGGIALSKAQEFSPAALLKEAAELP